MHPPSTPLRFFAGLAALAALSTVAPAQPASFQRLGFGCAIAGQVLSIGNNGLPRLGTRFSITYSGPNFMTNAAQQRCRPVLNIGFTTLGLPVPPIFPQQPGFCTIWPIPSLTVMTAADPTRPAWIDSVPFDVPNDPGLTGGALIMQWLALFEQCGVAGCGLEAVATSDAGIATIGT
jgi:hypothetical protein